MKLILEYSIRRIWVVVVIGICNENTSHMDPTCVSRSIFLRWPFSSRTTNNFPGFVLNKIIQLKCDWFVPLLWFWSWNRFIVFVCLIHVVSLDKSDMKSWKHYCSSWYKTIEETSGLIVLFLFFVVLRRCTVFIMLHSLFSSSPSCDCSSWAGGDFHRECSNWLMIILSWRLLICFGTEETFVFSSFRRILLWVDSLVNQDLLCSPKKVHF